MQYSLSERTWHYFCPTIYFLPNLSQGDWTLCAKSPTDYGRSFEEGDKQEKLYLKSCQHETVYNLAPQDFYENGRRQNTRTEYVLCIDNNPNVKTKVNLVSISSLCKSPLATCRTLKCDVKICLATPFQVIDGQFKSTLKVRGDLIFATLFYVCILQLYSRNGAPLMNPTPLATNSCITWIANDVSKTKLFGRRYILLASRLTMILVLKYLGTDFLKCWILSYDCWLQTQKGCMLNIFFEWEALPFVFVKTKLNFVLTSLKQIKDILDNSRSRKLFAFKLLSTLFELGLFHSNSFLIILMRIFATFHHTTLLAARSRISARLRHNIPFSVSVNMHKCIVFPSLPLNIPGNPNYSASDFKRFPPSKCILKSLEGGGKNLSKRKGENLLYDNSKIGLQTGTGLPENSGQTIMLGEYSIIKTKKGVFDFLFIRRNPPSSCKTSQK
ncbi:hypothetical protein EGR_05111 [Echinococcus granulosus]|uniref:Uncharacterized protein n=1 Tax=Echinococcus granulosus TaxID=6210 RepID=W6UEX7_ECHGR|nr:hypothetical protein EGR_05111 [Echinococcus granulosus]EUB59950.1 hypothetical protein EGR_05111 [Echinococcus granulosus]